jgi:hypothetical protein
MSPEIKNLLELINATADDLCQGFNGFGVVGICFKRSIHASKLTDAVRSARFPIGQARVIEIWVNSWGSPRRVSRFELTHRFSSL